MAVIAVPTDHLATVVTTLEMRVRPPPRRLPPCPLRLVPWPAPDPDRYRTLFRHVGAPWLWFSRLAMSDADLIAATHHPETQVHAVVTGQGAEVGLLELTHPEHDWCALDYFALMPGWTGRGHGRWLMESAMALAWRPGVSWVRVCTCTLDHPSALGFYQAQGFVPIRREVEIFPDPRALGILDAGDAPQVALLASPPPVSRR